MPSPNLSTNYSVLQAKNDLSGILHGTTTNQVAGINNIFNRAARQLLLDLDPQETKVIVQTPQLFDSVFNYPITNLPDLKGNKVIDIRPQVNRTGLDQFYQTYNKQFDVQKSYTAKPNFTINFNAGVKSLRIDATNLNTGILLNNANSLTSNGTWTANGTATTLAVNTTNYISPSGSSLMFNLPAGANPSTGGVINTTQVAVDLTTHQNQSYLFWYVYLPTGSAFTSTTLKFGSSSSNYYSVTATTNWDGVAFVNGWNLCGKAWTTATTTGTPTISSITYSEVDLTYNGTSQTSTQVNQIYSRLGQIYEIEYYSKYLFRDSTTGVFAEIVNNDSDLINLDTDTFNVYFDILCLLTIQQVSNKEYQDDITFWTNKYAQDLARYKALYKSEIIQPKSTYYAVSRPGYLRYYGSYPLNGS